MAGSNPIQPVEICSGLSLSPRIKLLFTVNRADSTVTPLDEWKLKRSLVDFLKTSPSLPRPVTVSEEDISIRRFKDPKKRKREDPVAEGSIFLRDLGFIEACAKKVRSVGGGDGVDEFSILKEELSRWRNVLVEKMDGMEVSLQGVKFRLTVSSPLSDDFEKMSKDWEEHFAFGNRRGYSRSEKHEPDTIVLRRVPSRWFAEPRVSSKPSMLVTHTIFSTLGKIRNLNVAEDDDLGNDATVEDGVSMVPGLYCKIVVQFDKHDDFTKALKILCGRSLQKEGSRLKADYELSWDKDEFFKTGRNSSAQQGRDSYNDSLSSARNSQFRDEGGPRRQPYTSRYSPEHVRSKRFKE